LKQYGFADASNQVSAGQKTGQWFRRQKYRYKIAELAWRVKPEID